VELVLVLVLDLMEMLKLEQSSRFNYIQLLTHTHQSSCTLTGAFSLIHCHTPASATVSPPRNYMLGVSGSSEMHIQRIKAYIFLQR
jgi:hypothetical protein